MDITRLWGKPQSTFEVFIRFVLAGSIVAASMGVAWIFISLRQDKAITADTTFAQTMKRPWGIALDGSGHIWAAEPDCDAAPLCAASNGRGAINEYNAVAGNLNTIANFIPDPSTLYNPTFLAFDKEGNVWFTDPTRGAIGKLDPETNTWTEYSVTNRFHGAVPYDLVIDKNGTLWFTDYTNAAIGRFNIETNKVVSETRILSKDAAPYGITLAPDGSIWYAIKNKKAIGSFKPPLKGTPVLQEHAVPTDQQHAITTDAAGDIWFSTGFNGRVGEYVPTTGTTRTFCVAGGAKNAHISGITVDNNNENVWFNDTTNARIGVLDLTQYNNDCANNSTSGIAYSQLAANAQLNDGLVVDSSGNVFFSDLTGKQVGEISIAPAKPNPTSPYPPGPVAKTWYFPAGHYGDGFREYITVINPDPTNQCTFTIQYIQDKGQSTSKHITLPAASTMTEFVNNDFYMSKQSPGNETPPVQETPPVFEKLLGAEVSAIVSNDDTSDCPGIVAERTLYFTTGDNSGSTIFGATHTATSFYFPDITNGAGARSLFNILDPSGIQSANVTVDYYANGAKVGTQSTRVSGGTHETIVSGQIRLPLHSVAVVTASQPVVVERTTYYRHVDGGTIGPINGASALIGATDVAHQWFFSPGFIGEKGTIGHVQGNLVISNLDPLASAPANVTINLDYANGSRHPFHLTVKPHSQVIWDVNAHAGAASAETAADVTSSGAGIVVQRHMSFQYAHAIDEDQPLNVQGITDMLGQTDIYRSVSFAEGDNNIGHQEWLNLYNPTGKTETIYVTMINGLSSVYSRSFQIEAYRHQVLDISSYTQHHLGIPGNIKSYNVFLTVQTLDGQRFVAGRSEYFNTRGSGFVVEGGTAASGYGGQ